MRLYGWAGLLLLVTSEICLFLRIEPFHSWFYSFAWWSYILLADNLLFCLEGRSLLTTRRQELKTMLPLSVFIWLVFEAYNLSLDNWGYEGVPAQMWLRWPGYTLAFATVLPGVFTTSDLAGRLMFGRIEGPGPSESESLSRAPDSSPRTSLLAAGAALSVAPIFWPRFFFPTVWLGPIFLLDPLLEKLGLQSLSCSIASGKRRRIWSLLVGGLLCGGMWEFWNFWAPSKWVYSVPFFGDWRIFEMPALGFFGFPPFAVECWILYHLLRTLLERKAPMPARAVMWTVIVLFSLLMFYNIDRNTVLRFADVPAWSVTIWRPA
jgi:hypothetical protein